MANPSTTLIHQDIGLVWNLIDGTTTTIVAAQITRAQTDIKHVTSTTTGDAQDIAIRNLADAYCVGNALSNLDPNTGNSENLWRMRTDFKKTADNALRVIGKSLDGIKVQFNVVNP